MLHSDDNSFFCKGKTEDIILTMSEQFLSFAFEVVKVVSQG